MAKTKRKSSVERVEVGKLSVKRSQLGNFVKFNKFLMETIVICRF